ncbi:threonine dehydratase [Anabaena subtropica]|uniref:Threonine dehydratase n=1 Tax=Anabaena subtropica FACHB-260 TaxID=2692884 RepID=A0ABR8CH58_9NOST|nr:threonine dehydratase [Anabaena subtropica]MBD2342550.1 threonine dehydratase [Anabaena subtropica FACHB-260]
MFRLIQILRNLFLRLEGLFGVFFKGLLSLVSNIFGFFAKIFGFTKSGYFLENDEAQSIKESGAKEPMQSAQNATPEIFTPTTTRRPKAKMDDYYLNMAREVNKN